MKVSLAQVGTIKKDLDESQLQEVVTEIVIGALRGTNVHLNLFQYPSCPRLWREPASTQPSFSIPMHYDNVVSVNYDFHATISFQKLIINCRLTFVFFLVAYVEQLASKLAATASDSEPDPVSKPVRGQRQAVARQSGESRGIGWGARRR